jgi:hypothetical protein
MKIHDIKGMTKEFLKTADEQYSSYATPVFMDRGAGMIYP